MLTTDGTVNVSGDDGEVGTHHPYRRAEVASVREIAVSDLLDVLFFLGKQLFFQRSINGIVVE